MNLSNRESYHDYIGRRLREEDTFGDGMMENTKS